MSFKAILYNMKKFFIRLSIVLSVLVALWLLAAVAMALLSEKFVFHPSPNKALEIENTQVFFDRKFGQAQESGEKIESFWVKNSPSGKIVLYLSGSGGTLPEIIAQLAQEHAVFAPSYPEYGVSEGKASTQTVYESAQAAVEFLLAQGYRQEDIIVWGHSLGGSPSVYLATLYPNFDKVILVNTFDSIQNMGYRRYGPLAIFAGGIFDSITNAPLTKGKIRQFHVENDDEIPLEAAQKLFDALGAQDKSFSMVGGDHSHPDVAATLK